MLSLCDDCIRKYDEERDERIARWMADAGEEGDQGDPGDFGASDGSPSTVSRPAANTTPSQERRSVGSESLCVGFGIVFLAVGFWFLVINPGEGAILGLTVVNLQRIAIGQTSAIVGAIFLAAGIRPRR
jgi:hypothetical protein